MKVGISGQRALERIDRLGRLAAVRKHEAEVREHEGIARFHSLCLAKRRRRIVEISSSRLAARQTEMGVRRRQLRVDRGSEPWHGIPAAVGLEQRVTQSKVRLWVCRILFENPPQLLDEFRSLQLPRGYTRDARGKLALVFWIRSVRTGCDASASDISQRLQPGRGFAVRSRSLRQIAPRIALHLRLERGGAR